MLSNSKLVVFFVLAAVIIRQATVDAAVMPPVCSAEEDVIMPCVCCKKACWTGVTDMTTAYFGHMPGEENDAEVKFTLAMIRECFSIECQNVCSSLAR